MSSHTATSGKMNNTSKHQALEAEGKEGFAETQKEECESCGAGSPLVWFAADGDGGPVQLCCRCAIRRAKGHAPIKPPLLHRAAGSVTVPASRAIPTTSSEPAMTAYSELTRLGVNCRGIAECARPALLHVLTMPGAACPLSLDEFVRLDTGLVAPNLTALVRHEARDEERSIRVFVYSSEAVCAWVRRAGTDPVTREPVSLKQLIRIS